MNTPTTISNPNQFKYICRACRKFNKDMRPIFNSEVNSVQVSQMLSFAATINVRPDDNLPKSLCSPCLKKLIDTYEFQQICIDSDIELRNILKIHFNSKSITVEKIHNHQQHQNLLPSAAKPFLKSALLKNAEFRRTELYPGQNQPQLSNNDNNTHIDVIEYDGTLIKFENQDYDEFDNFEYGSMTTSDNKTSETIKFRNRHETISRVGNKNNQVTYNSIEPRIANANLRCNFCEKEFIQKDDLQKHQAIHTPLKSNSMYIHKSPEFFNKSMAIMKESSSPPNIQPIIGKFSCAFCKNTFHTWENLAKHIGEHKIKSIYGTDNPGNPNTLNKTVPIDIETTSIAVHQCTYCLQRFQYRNDLICHMNEHINEINVNKSRENLAEQMIQLQTIREVPIDIENEKPRLLENESDETNGTKFYCQFCSSNYTLKSSLRKHILLKHKKNISNLEKYQCSYCRRLFVKYLDMVRHRKIHKEKNKSKNDKPSVENEKSASQREIECQYCGTTIKQGFNLKRHIRNRHPEVFTNKDRTKSTTNLKIRRKKKVVISNSTYKKYKCNNCGKLYNKYLDMIRHRKTVHTIKTKEVATYKCPHCPTLIKWSLANLRRHIKTHKDITTSKLDEPSTLVESPKPVLTVKEQSIKTKLLPIRLFDKFIKCQYCELTLCSKADLQRHMIKMHKELTGFGLKKYECMYCEKTFKKYFDMRSHQKHHKKRNDPILKPKPSTAERNSSITSTSNFEVINELSETESSINIEDTTDPLEINKGNKSLIPVQCNICSVVLRNIYSHNRHIKQVHGINENETVKVKTEPLDISDGFNCTFCVKNFKTSNALNTHLHLKHSSKSNDVSKSKSNPSTSRENNQYNCRDCDKSYETSLGLRRHNIKVHSNSEHMNSDGFYECSICEKKFIRKLGYLYHSRMHKEKPEEDLRRKCVLCKKILKHSLACRRHYRTVHLDQIEQNENTQKDEDKYRCKICSKGWRRLDSYKNHIKRHLVCGEDNEPANFEKNKEKAVQKEMPSIQKIEKTPVQKKHIRCMRCPLIFLDKEKYLKHVQIHKLKIQKMKHKQELKMQKMKRKQELNEKKIQKKTYKCNICGKVVSLISNYNSHMAAHERRKTKIDEMGNTKLIVSNVEMNDSDPNMNEEYINLHSFRQEIKLDIKTRIETPVILMDQTEQLLQTDVPEQISNIKQ